MSSVLLLHYTGQIHAASCRRHSVIRLLIVSFVLFRNILSGFVHHHIIIILLSRCWVRPVSFRCFEHVCQYSRGVWYCGHRDVTVVCCVVSGGTVLPAWKCHCGVLCCFRCFEDSICQYSRGVRHCGHRNVTVVCCVVSGVLNTAFVKTAEEYDTWGIEMLLWCDVLFQVF